MINNDLVDKIFKDIDEKVKPQKFLLHKIHKIYKIHKIQAQKF